MCFVLPVLTWVLGTCVLGTWSSNRVLRPGVLPGYWVPGVLPGTGYLGYCQGTGYLGCYLGTKYVGYYGVLST